VAVLSGARLLGRLQASRAIAALSDGPPELALAEASDEAILDDFRARGGTVYHPCGTCRMAPEDRGGVVDDQLRVHGFENLHVCDASVFPNVTSANTNAPTIMAACKAAPMILGA
jgi:choline dehydrogenase